MAELFRIVARWIAAILISVPAGGLGTAAGYGPLTIAAGAVLLLVGGTFVAGSVLSTQFAVPSRIGRVATDGERSELGALAGPALDRAVFLAFIGGGLAVGALNPTGYVGAISAVCGAVVLLLAWLGSPARAR